MSALSRPAMVKVPAKRILSLKVPSKPTSSRFNFDWNANDFSRSFLGMLKIVIVSLAPRNCCPFKVKTGRLRDTVILSLRAHTCRESIKFSDQAVPLMFDLIKR